MIAFSEYSNEIFSFLKFHHSVLPLVSFPFIHRNRVFALVGQTQRARKQRANSIKPALSNRNRSRSLPWMRRGGAVRLRLIPDFLFNRAPNRPRQLLFPYFSLFPFQSSIPPPPPLPLLACHALASHDPFVSKHIGLMTCKQNLPYAQTNLERRPIITENTLSLPTWLSLDSAETKSENNRNA